jgi:membrane protease YdiL (CAAX protease family)
LVVDDVASPRYDTWPEAVVAALVLIPLGTVIPEELVFRGVLWGLLRRARGTRVATVGSSMLFGLWHVGPALGGGPANDALTGAVGSGVMGTILGVLATVVFTSAAGVVLCYVRQRSDSLLAPILLHWAANGAGVLFVLLA